MPRHSVRFVPRFGVVSQQPLHDFRQRTAFICPDGEMDVVSHDAKVVNGERMFLFRPGNEGEEEGAHGNFIENHFTPVYSCRNVVDGVLFKLSVVSHALYMARMTVLLYCLGKKVSVTGFCLSIVPVGRCVAGKKVSVTLRIDFSA
jgi:hypothetical protein